MSGVYVDICMYNTKNKSKCTCIYIYIYISLDTDKDYDLAQGRPILWTGRMPMTNKTATVLTTTKIWS